VANYTYNHGSTTIKDRARLIIPDKPENNRAVFSDEELADLGTLWGDDPFAVAAAACEIIAMDRAKQAVSFSINGASVNKAQIPSYFLQRAKELRQYAVTNQPWEYVESIAYSVSPLGISRSYYIGDEDES
jgi:hypothetical protein